jgi:hypothetical protein
VARFRAHAKLHTIAEWANRAVAGYHSKHFSIRTVSDMPHVPYEFGNGLSPAMYLDAKQNALERSGWDDSVRSRTDPHGAQMRKPFSANRTAVRTPRSRR